MRIKNLKTYRQLQCKAVLQKKSKWTIFLLFLFLLCFPKGGIKISGIPITWGYLFIGTLSFFLILKKEKKLIKSCIWAFTFTIPFQLIMVLTFLIYGHEKIQTATSIIVNFSCLPIIFFLILPEQLEKIDFCFLQKLFVNSIFFISIYGIFLFFFKLTTGSFLELPLLTVNLDDVGGLEYKHIQRKFFFKLISTYNNGNLYGICLLILLPFYQYLEKSFVKKMTAIISLVLTFSLTVWSGLILLEFFYFLMRLQDQKKIKQPAKKSFFLLLIIVNGIIFHKYFAYLFKIDRLLTLHSRLSSIPSIENLSMLPSSSFSTISEMVYVHIVKNFGVIGLFFFMLAMIGPMLSFFMHKKDVKENRSSYLILGLIIYLICATVDGAIMLIPTMLFYWFISCLLLCFLSKNSAISS